MTDDLRAVIAKIKEPFAPEDHDIRDLPGKGQWIFVPWQKYRERLDEAYPAWEVSYSNPIYDEKYCMIKCTLTIMNVKREAWGIVPIVQTVTKEGKDVSRGTGPDRAIAEALKNAVESFGGGAYLDNQEEALRIASKSKYQHNREALMSYAKTLKINLGLIPEPKTVREEAQEYQEAKGVKGKLINDKQVGLVWGKVRQYKISTIGLQSILKNYGYSKVEEIEYKKLDNILSDFAASENAPSNEVSQAKQNNETTPNPRPSLSASTGVRVDLKSSQVSDPNNRSQGFKQATPPARLYPKHAAIIQNIRALTKHDKDCVIAECNRFNKDHPADLAPNELQSVLETLATDWAIMNDIFKKREEAIASFSQYVNHFVSQGQGIEDAVIGWMNDSKKQSLRVPV